MPADAPPNQAPLLDRPLLRPHMPEMDSVRGIVILLVLFFHGMAPPLHADLSSGGKLLFSVSQYGWVGVNLFFVLSGFLITGILLDGRSRTGSLRHFYVRRALRILPALYAMLLVLLVGGWVSWPFVALGALFLANYAPLVGVPLQYGPLWSLAVEEHFYMIWPWMVRRLPPRKLMFLLAAVVAATPAIRALDFIMLGPPADFVALYTWFNLDGLALGAMLAVWLRWPGFRRGQLSRIAPPIFVAGALAFVLLFKALRWETVFSASALKLAFAGLVACMLLVGTSRWSGLVNQALLRFFGYISYGLYLVHVLAFRLGEILLQRQFATLVASGRSTSAMLLRFVSGGGLAIVLAYLSRRSLEEGFLRMGSSTRSECGPAGAA